MLAEVDVADPASAFQRTATRCRIAPRGGGSQSCLRRTNRFRLARARRSVVEFGCSGGDQCDFGRAAGKRDKECLTCIVSPRLVRPFDDGAAQRRRGFDITTLLEHFCKPRARVCDQPRMRDGIGDRERATTVRLGSVQVALCERDRTKPGQRKGSVIGKARPLGAFERSTVRGRRRLRVSALLCQARFEQCCRDRTDVVVAV
jgi:hypothetical protein